MCHDLGLPVGADRAQIEATIGEAIARAAKASGIKSGMAPRRLLDQLKPTTLYFICEDWKVEWTHLESGDYKSLARQLVTHRIQDACFTRPFLDEAASSSHPSPSQAPGSSRGFTLAPAPPFGPPDYTPSCSYATSNSRVSVAPWSAASCASSWECPRPRLWFLLLRLRACSAFPVLDEERRERWGPEAWPRWGPLRGRQRERDGERREGY